MNHYSTYTVAKQHQAELIAEAEHERLVREARASNPGASPSPARRLVAAAAAAILALAIGGAALAQNDGANSVSVNHGGQPCVEISDSGKLAC